MFHHRHFIRKATYVVSGRNKKMCKTQKFRLQEGKISATGKHNPKYHSAICQDSVMSCTDWSTYRHVIFGRPSYGTLCVSFDTCLVFNLLSVTDKILFLHKNFIYFHLKVVGNTQFSGLDINSTYSNLLKSSTFSFKGESSCTALSVRLLLLQLDPEC